MSADEVIAEIERFLDEAKPVPLTKHVRLDPNRLRELLEKLKEQLDDEQRRGL